MARLRRVLDKVLRDWGHDVILQRASGDAWKWTAEYERHTVRSMYPSGRAALAHVQEERTEGLVHTVDMIYYFRRDACPREMDRIYEKDDRYPSGQTTWLIDYALPMRGKGGLVDYWMVGATRENP